MSDDITVTMNIEQAMGDSDEMAQLIADLSNASFDGFEYGKQHVSVVDEFRNDKAPQPGTSKRSTGIV